VRQQSEIYNELAERVGEAHLRQRLMLQVEHASQVFGQGRTLLHIENVEWLPVVVYWGLRLVGLYGLGHRNARALEVHTNEVVIDELLPSLEGMRILHLSDLHLDLDPGLTDVIIDRIQKLDVDLCVFTGDYRASTSGPYELVVEQMSRVVDALDAPAYGVLGNHDFIEFVPPLEAAGLRMLLNETVAVECRGSVLHLSGVDDPHFYEAESLERVAAGVPPHQLAVLLSHSPEIYRQAAAVGYSLMLSGHTHAGQICLPGGVAILTNARCPRRFKKGPWLYGPMHGYTSPGAGCSGVPVRFFCPPAVTVHVLRAA
jgi:predicted MPP superfamily phosphohydrolase